MRRRNTVIPKWVSTRSPVKETRAKLATDRKEEKQRQLWLEGQDWCGRCISKQGVGQKFEKKGRMVLR